MSESKEAGGAELHKAIRRIVNDLRDRVGCGDFKLYVLGALSYRCIRDNLISSFSKSKSKSKSKNEVDTPKSTIVSSAIMRLKRP